MLRCSDSRFWVSLADRRHLRPHPRVRGARLSLTESLKEGGKNIGGARSHRIRNSLVVAEIALALVLLVGAGLLIRSFARLQGVDPGFNANNLLTMKVSLPGRKYDTDRKRIDFFRQAVAQMQSLPGVESVGAVSFLPFAAPNAGTGVEIEGRRSCRRDRGSARA